MDKISIYELLYPDVFFSTDGNTQVACPFPHYTSDGQPYYEDNPSAGIDISKGLFHCFTCQRGHNEVSFTAEYLGCSQQKAQDFIKTLQKSFELSDWEYAVKNLQTNKEMQLLLDRLGISNEVAEELQLGYKGNGLSIPVILFGRIFDIVTYRPGQTPKYLRSPGSMSGLIIPFDQWVSCNKNKTIICAGEKDMLIARSKGFNAITFTGGEGNTPSLFLNMFEGKEVYIIYDNDDAGRVGSSKLAAALYKHAKSVYNVNLSQICVDKGEDLWDFFMKYKKTKEDLIKIMQNTPKVTEDQVKELNNIDTPLVSLHEATTPKYINRMLRSNIQVVATTDTIFSIPTEITGIKGENMSEKDTVPPGTQKHWTLNEQKYKDMFYLIDSNLKENKIEQHIISNLLYFPSRETDITIKKRNNKPVYKCVVTDLIVNTSSAPLTEFTAYSINKRLENGKKYTVTYKIVPHPQDGQRLIMVIKDVEESDEFIDNFKITPEVKESLNKFRVQNGFTFEEKFNDTIERVKGIVDANYNNLLLMVIDLWFHSALQIQVGKNIIRGYLDTLLVGESRIGKSSTVTALQEMYQLTKTVSLAGTSATIAGLIGGSNKVGGSFQTRAGIIPQNNKGGIVFEELVKCNANIIKELTEIRSSNLVRITRVSGALELPAYVRMLTLTNSKTTNGVPKPISQYPNGIEILTDIVGTPEDIARYDLIAIFGFNANTEIDPFYTPPTPYAQIDYQTRIRWIWSRTPEQIVVSRQIYTYLINKCNELNKEFDCFIKIFGIEAWKKVIRLATAIAGYMVSTDPTYQKIIVETEHIDKAIEIMRNLYDNPTFKLKEFVKEEKRFREFTQKDIDNLQLLYQKNNPVINLLSNASATTRTNLFSVSGLDITNFNRLIGELSVNNFIRMSAYEIIPTEKFFNTFKQINKDIVIDPEVTLNVSI